MNEVEMFKQMLVMQDEINTIVNPYWRDAKYAWHRAVWIECAELIEHHGYKWWKQQQPEWDQITLEIVDIWHFGMSLLLGLPILHEDLANDLALHYATVVQDDERSDNFVEKVEVLAGTATTGIFDTLAFFDVMLTVDIDLELLYIMYVGKNVLNKFRQANGYKEGTYHKVWFDGREDNEHLTDIMNSASFQLIEPVNQISHILAHLAELYHTVKPSIPVAHTDEITEHSNGC